MTTIAALRAQVRAIESRHPETPPPPPRVGARLAAWAEAQGLPPATVAACVGLPLARVRAIFAGQALTAAEARAFAAATDDDRVTEAAAAERLRGGL